MKAIERLYQYLEYNDIKPTRFEKNIGLSNGYLRTQLRRKADLGESVIVNIIDNCLDLSLSWLLIGEGEMLRKDGIEMQKDDEKDGLKDKIIELLEEKVERLERELKEKNNTGAGEIMEEFISVAG